MSQPRLILHIGTEKTGTTALQHWLRAHRDRLAQHGLALPTNLGPTNHRRLPTSCFDPDRIDDFVIRSGLAEDRQLRLATYRHWQDCFREAVQQSEAPLWLVSSEHFSSRLSRPSELQRLQQLLQPLHRRVQVVLYLRDPLATAVSAWSTLVFNGGYPLEALPPPDHPLLLDKCDHRGLVQRWLHWFPELQLRLYRPDVIADFCALLGLPAELARLDSGLYAPRNASLPHAAIVAIARLNRQHAVYVGRDLNPEREQRIAEIVQRTQGMAAYRPGGAEIRAYRHHYADSTAWIQRHYFPDQQVLFS